MDPRVCSLDDEACLSRDTPATAMDTARGRLDVQALYQTTLTPINCNFSMVKALEDKKKPLQSVVKKEKSKATACVIAYVLRHPACGACREKGKVLSEFVSKDIELSFFTIVKESGVVDKALLQYFSDYGSHNPIYQDPEMGIYKAMGGRQASVIAMARGITKQLWRGYRTKVKPNFVEVTKGDLWTQGGVLIFDRKGRLAHIVYEPDFGKQLDMKEISDAVAQVKRVQMQQRPKEASV